MTDKISLVGPVTRRLQKLIDEIVTLCKRFGSCPSKSSICQSRGQVFELKELVAVGDGPA